MTQVQKQADIRYRVELKNKPIVVYKVMSAFGVDMYDVTLVNGKVNNCTCPARKPCYHWRDVQAREDERKAQEQASREIMPLNGNKAFSLMR